MRKKTVIRNLVQLTEDKNQSYTARVVDKLGGRVVDELVYQLMQDDDFDIKKFFRNQKKIHDVMQLEKTIRGLAEDRMTGEVNGHEVDGFSAFMVSRVLDQLTQEQKIRLLSKPTNEIIAISYKLASRAEI